jgi:hypothetical protein
MQRLGQALEAGNLQQARYEFETLVNIAPEPGQPDSMAHPQFTALGRVIQERNLTRAREGFARLQSETHPLRAHSNERPREMQASDVCDEQIKSPAADHLDVTA